jgi:ABC-type branched-subunit amino acid transport system ATPase component
MQARSEPMQGDRVAREQRSIRITEIINHGLHRQTDSMAGWIFEQGQLVHANRCYLMSTGRIVHEGLAKDLAGSDVLHSAYLGEAV